jgi:hypothetical protein
MILRQTRRVGIGQFPAPIIGNPVVIHKNQVDLAGIGGPFAAVGPVSMGGNAAVAAPANPARVFVFVPAQALKDGDGFLEDGRDDIGGLAGMAQTSFGHGEQSIVGNLDGEHSARVWVYGVNA